jgi:hypothetical protein
VSNRIQRARCCCVNRNSDACDMFSRAETDAADEADLILRQNLE